MGLGQVIILKFWLNDSHEPTRHGYTAATEDTVATFRIGPAVIGWEAYSDE